MLAGSVYCTEYVLLWPDKVAVPIELFDVEEGYLDAVRPSAGLDELLLCAVTSEANATAARTQS